MRWLWALVVACGVVGATGSVAGPDVTAAEGALLTSMVATAASSDPRVDVLTMSDLRKAIALAADRQLLDCRNADTCLAEIAAAMDAAAVLHGEIGLLGERVVLNLALFDTTASTAVGRTTARGADVAAVADQIEPSVVRLLEKLPTGEPGRRVRVLVLDLERAGTRNAGLAADGSGPAGTTESQVSPWVTWPAWVGSGLAGLGLVGGLAAAWTFDQARSFDRLGRSEPTAVGAARLYDRRDTATTIAVAAAGGSLLALSGGTVLLIAAYAE
jgi:hypothetical protein